MSRSRIFWVKLAPRHIKLVKKAVEVFDSCKTVKHFLSAKSYSRLLLTMLDRELKGKINSYFYFFLSGILWEAERRNAERLKI